VENLLPLRRNGASERAGFNSAFPHIWGIGATADERRADSDVYLVLGAWGSNIRYNANVTCTLWLTAHWAELTESAGIVGGLLFSGFGFLREARARRAETLVEITKQHRELWNYFDDRRDLSPLFDDKREMAMSPLTTSEIRFVNSLVLHLRATFYARKAGIYVQPECLSEDIRGFFSYPAPRAAWEKLRRTHDGKFVVFVERSFGAEPRTTLLEYLTSLARGFRGESKQSAHRGHRKPLGGDGQENVL